MTERENGRITEPERLGTELLEFKAHPPDEKGDGALPKNPRPRIVKRCRRKRSRGTSGFADIR